MASVAAETRTERNVRTSIDQRSHEHRQLSRPIAVIAVEEDNYVGFLHIRHTGQTGAAITPTRFLDNLCSHLSSHFGCAICRIAVDDDDLGDAIERQIAKHTADRLRFVMSRDDDRDSHANLPITTTKRKVAD